MDNFVIKGSEAKLKEFTSIASVKGYKSEDLSLYNSPTHLIVSPKDKTIKIYNGIRLNDAIDIDRVTGKTKALLRMSTEFPYPPTGFKIIIEQTDKGQIKVELEGHGFTDSEVIGSLEIVKNDFLNGRHN